MSWGTVLPVDPVPALLSWDDPALAYFAHRDLLDCSVEPVEALWVTAQARQVLKKQSSHGGWAYSGKSYDPRTGTNYNLVETYRRLRLLIEMYGFHRGHPAIQKAAEFLFSCQTEVGDLRGILGNQHMPYYHGTLLELLIKAGYAQDERLLKGLDWLLSIRQNDGGWLVPAQTVPSRQRTPDFWLGPAIAADRTKASSHLATGMVLRAFAAHPEYRRCEEVLSAADWLKSRFFQSDHYNDRKTPAYWLKFQFPFWWTSLLTALDSLSWLGFERQDPQVSKGLEWFLTGQSADGLWPTAYGKGKCAEENRLWVGLAACRMLKRFFTG